jgi:hypothetical protein
MHAGGGALTCAAALAAENLLRHLLSLNVACMNEWMKVASLFQPPSGADEMKRHRLKPWLLCMHE